MIEADVFYRELPLCDLDKFGNMFSTAQKSAFRLELLDVYSVPEEEAFFNTYLASPRSLPPADFNSDWKMMLEEARARGLEHSRVRVLRQPVTDYLKFEISWGYRESLKLGERIKVITTDSIINFKTEVPLLKDFWLFDERQCYLVEYDFLGTFLGVRQIPESYTSHYVHLKQEAIDASVNIDQHEIWKTLVSASQK